MKEEHMNSLFRILSGMLLVLSAASPLVAQVNSTSTTVVEDVFAAKTSDQFVSAYFNSTSAGRIADLQSLSIAISRFNAVANGTSIPGWLQTILSDALNSQDPDVAKAAIEQVGSNGIVFFSSKLLSLYSQWGSQPQNGYAGSLRTSIVNSLGSLGTADAIAFLGQIVDLHQVNPETDMAIAAIGRLCLTGLVPNIDSYAVDLQARMQNGEFNFTPANVQIVQQSTGSSQVSAQSVAPSNVTKSKPLVSPENSLNIARGAIQAMENGTCGK